MGRYGIENFQNFKSKEYDTMTSQFLNKHTLTKRWRSSKNQLQCPYTTNSDHFSDFNPPLFYFYK